MAARKGKRSRDEHGHQKAREQGANELTVLVVICKLEAENIVHELDGDIVAEKHDVVARGGISAEIRLGSLGDTGIAHERRPD